MRSPDARCRRAVRTRGADARCRRAVQTRGADARCRRAVQTRSAGRAVPDAQCRTRGADARCRPLVGEATAGSVPSGASRLSMDPGASSGQVPSGLPRDLPANRFLGVAARFEPGTSRETSCRTSRSTSRRDAGPNTTKEQTSRGRRTGGADGRCRPPCRWSTGAYRPTRRSMGAPRAFADTAPSRSAVRDVVPGSELPRWPRVLNVSEYYPF